ncbi:bromodomain-containing protein [Sporobolomyces salmoneus]|uniref:bromodomain-containing protein n=1 Tax=Sporobolomyces salmoneus TaxID=183962 RepID=UPI003172451E
MSAFQQDPPPSQLASAQSQSQSQSMQLQQSEEAAIPPPPPPPPVVSHEVSKPSDESLAAQRPPTPPPSLPSIDQQQQFAPPPPAVPFPSEIVQPPQLQHMDSNTASSVIAEPPTPLASTPAPPPQPSSTATEAEEPPRSNGTGEHAGLGMGMHGEGHSGQSAVDVLADVAMGEAAMDLAGFAAGGVSQSGAVVDGEGSGDVREEGGVQAAMVPPPPPVVEPSPPLKRSYEESTNGYFGASVNGAGSSSVGAAEVNGTSGEDSREAKRPRVEEVIPQETASVPQVSVQPPSIAPVEHYQQLPPAPAPAQTPPTPQPPVQPSASPAPPPLDPSLAAPLPPPSSNFSAAPPSAPSPVSLPSAPAPTMSPSDLHHFPAVAQPQSNAATPLPPHQPSPAPSSSQPPSQFPAYDSSSNAFSQPQASPYPSQQMPPVSQPHQHSQSPYPAPSPSPAAAQSQIPEVHASSASPYPYPPPVASTSSTGIAPSPIPSTSHQQHSPYPPTPSNPFDQQLPQDPSASSTTPNPNEPPPAEPIAVMTKEQQKHAINLVRNLKRNKNASPFLKPVDHIALHIPDYYKIITQPMDLGTIEGRLQATGKAMTNVHKVGRIYGLDYSYGTQPGQWEGIVPEGFEPKGYRTVQEFKEDLDRVWNNCFRYNGPRDKNPVSAMAGNMMDAAEKSYRGMPYAPAVSPYPPRHVEPPKIKQEPRPAPGFIPTIRRDDSSSRPKREIHAPVKDLAYLDSADPSLGAMAMAGGGGGGMQYHQQQHPGMMMQGMPGAQKPRNGRKSQAQEQLRFCKETIKELFKKSHESYAYPFYHPVDLAAYPTYSQYVSRPMDLGTIRSKLEHNQYPLPPYDAFESDVRQIFENCFAFNPAGTIVHEWGRQLEAVFEIKWAERPMDDDFSEDDGLNVMEQQLQMLAANIEQMRQNKKAQKEAKRFQAQQNRPPMMMPPMPMSMAPTRPPKQKSSSNSMGGAYNPYAPARAAQPKKARPSGGGGNGHKKKKRRDDDSDDYYEDDGGAYYAGSAHMPVHHGVGGLGASHGAGAGGGGGNRRHIPVQQEEWVDFEMKRELAVKIVTFEGEQLQEAIDIIRRGRPDLLGAANQEVELDIDQLDQRTLVALYRYVCPGAPVAVRPVENPKPSKQQTSNKQPRNQRKNLDEEAEAERIRMMEAQLAAFEKTGSMDASAVPTGGALPGTPQGQIAGEEGAQGGGDQASSDSSDEASSDSDSDED